MSRIGRKPVNVPQGVEVKVEGNDIMVKGPKGSLSLKIQDRRIAVSVEDSKVFVRRVSDDKKVKALHGLYRALINNMVTGVTRGYVKELDIMGLGYRATTRGDELVISVGYHQPIVFKPPDGVRVYLKSSTRIVVEGVDKQLVGQVAASIRAIKPPWVYKDMGIKYADEVLRKKPGKSAKKK